MKRALPYVLVAALGILIGAAVFILCPHLSTEATNEPLPRSAITVGPGVTLPSYTTTQKNAFTGVPLGSLVFDSTMNQVQIYANSSSGNGWQTLYASDANTNEPTALTGNNTLQGQYLWQSILTSRPTDPSFSSNYMINPTAYCYHGLYTADGQIKTTFAPFDAQMHCRAQGQRGLYLFGGDMWGGGDCYVLSGTMNFWGGQASGDEGQTLIDMDLWEGTSVVKTTITNNAPAGLVSTCNTTTTQAITKNRLAQTVSVGSTTGMAAGNWIIIDPEPPGSAADIETEAVKIISVVDSTHVNAVFTGTHLTGVNVLPATVLTLNSASNMGQMRWLVNLTQPSYTTGTIANTAARTFTGTSTVWTNTMVGGDAGGLCVGVITATKDNNTGAAGYFSAGNPLRDYYPINAVSSNTVLTIRRATGGYHGNVTGSDTAAYTILPGAQILAFDPPNNGSNTVVLNYNTFTWANNDSVECAHNNEMAVYGSIIRTQVQSTGANLSAMYFANNTGPVQCGDGFICDSTGASSGGYIRGFRAKGATINSFYADQCSGTLLTAGSLATPAHIIQQLGTSTWNLNLAALTATRTQTFPDQAGNVMLGTNQTITYAATMTPDCGLGSYAIITVTDANAITMNAPTHPTAGMQLTFEIVNSSGGAMGAITWNAAYHLAGAFTNPASTFRRTITFRYNGSIWVETNRAAADISLLSVPADGMERAAELFLAMAA